MFIVTNCLFSGTHVYMANQFNAKKIDESARYIVLDDIDLDYFPSYKSFFGGQKEFEVTDKYVSKMTVKWGKPCIWLSNEDPRNKKVDRPWVEANCVFVNVESPLYEVANQEEVEVRAPLFGEDTVYLEDLYTNTDYRIIR